VVVSVKIKLSFDGRLGRDGFTCEVESSEGHDGRALAKEALSGLGAVLEQLRQAHDITELAGTNRGEERR
jgi:hypothetical protein